MTDIDTAILAKLNDGRLGSDNGRHRRADRIVTLEIYVIQIDDQHQVLFEQVGPRDGEEQYYKFENCGSLTETRPYQETITKEHSAEVEMTNVVKTSTSFSGKLTTSCKMPLDGMQLGIGTEGTAAFSKDFTVTDHNKQTNSIKTEEVQKWDLVVPAHTRVIYQIVALNGTKQVQFTGIVVVRGVYHYVIDQVWDQNATIEAALPDEKDRTFPFSGILTTVNFQEVDIKKTEEPLTDQDCAARAVALPDTNTRAILLDRQLGKLQFDAIKNAAA